MDNIDFSEIFSNFGALTLSTVLHGLLLLVVGLVLIRIALGIFDRVLAHSKKLSPLSSYLRSVLKVLLYVLLALVVLGSLGVQVASFVALLSVAGLAVSLALQNTLANVAGGIMILVSDPFDVGDYVSCDGVDGTVRAIGISHTIFTTVDNKEIFVPNAQIAAAKIVNFNKLGRRRLDLTFSASYDAPTAEVKAAIFEAMEDFPQIMPDPAPAVYLTAYGNSSITYSARMWVASADYWTVNFGMLERVRECFAAHGVEMTYDHLNVHIQDRT